MTAYGWKGRVSAWSPHGDAHSRIRELDKRLIKRGNAPRSDDLMNGLLRELRQRRGTEEGQQWAMDVRGLGGESRWDAHRRRVMALEGLMPSVETISMKRGGAAYQVPVPLSESRRISLAVRWFLEGAKQRVRQDRVHGMVEAMVQETLWILRDRSQMELAREGTRTGQEVSGDWKSYAVPKRRARHRTAKANRVFAHMRWR